MAYALPHNTILTYLLLPQIEQTVLLYSLLPELSTVMPLGERLCTLTFALTRLESAYIFRDSSPSLSNSSLISWKISPNPS